MLSVQCDPCAETGRPATQETHGGIGCRKKDDRGERACRQSLFDSWTDAVTSGLTVNERTERKRVISRRALAWPAEETERCLRNQASTRSSSKNLMVKPLETRTSLDVDRSRSFALRG